MAFNNKKNNVYDSNGLTFTSEEKELNKQFDLLSMEFIDLQKDFEYLKENISQINEISNKEYKSIRKSL